MGHQPQDKKPDKGGNDYDPWTGRKKQPSQQPPDLDAFLRQLQQKIRHRLKGGKINGPSGPMAGGPSSLFAAKLGLIPILLFIIWLLSGFFIVQPAERAVILRFGRYITTLDPGPHWIPTLIERRFIINEQKVETFSYQDNMLTKDQTIVTVAVSVHYRIGNAQQYLFNVVSPVESLQQATASALRQVIGHSDLDAVITYGRSVIRQQVQDQLQTTLARYQTGLIITGVDMQPARAPDQVKEAFDDAIKAQEDEQRLINQAQAYAMKVLPLAQGAAKRLISEATAYKEKTILQSSGEAAHFNALVNEYHKAPKVTRARIYLQNMEKIYQNTNKVILDINQGSPVVYLPLDKLMSQTPEQMATAHTTTVAASTSVATDTNTNSTNEPLLETMVSRDRPLDRDERNPL